jgi:uncharacterized protein (DUF362 family)
MLANIVSVSFSSGTYPDSFPFNPSILYPEYPLGHEHVADSNPVYEAVRNSFHLLGLDRDRFGTQEWNPLNGIVKPGDQVFVKPNAVLNENLSGDSVYAVVTHPAVLRAVIDYVSIALRGKGSIIVGDAPQYNSDFDDYLDKTQLQELVNFLSLRLSIDIALYDLRKIVARVNPNRGYISVSELHTQSGDPSGYTVVDLGDKSAMDCLTHKSRIYGAEYDRKQTISNHADGVHNYCIANSILESDVIISVPKLKVHRKVGITINIKGLVGINGDKNYLAHYRIGPPSRGGDEYPDALPAVRKISQSIMRIAADKLLGPRKRCIEPFYAAINKVRLFTGKVARILGVVPTYKDRDTISHGDWHGNDTAWRMAVDLLRIALCTDRDGRTKDYPVRRFFSVVDGIVSGEGEGPLAPYSRQTNLIVSGSDPIAVDSCCGALMGYNLDRLPILYHFKSFNEPNWSGFTGWDTLSIRFSDRELGFNEILPLEPLFQVPIGWRSITHEANHRN